MAKQRQASARAGQLGFERLGNAWQKIEDASRLDRLKTPGAIIALLVILGMGVLWPLNITAHRDLPTFNFLLQILFIGVASCGIAALAIRSFLRTGQWPVLWLGAGSLAFGIGAPFAGALLNWSATNAAVTTHNLSALMAGLLHFVGAFFVVNNIAPHDSARGRRSIVFQVFLGLLGLMTLITLGALLGWFPSFFVQGEGGSRLRQIVVLSATLLFFFSGLIFLREYQRTQANFLFWYAFGLILTALGIGAIMVATTLGSPLNWLGRSAQFLAGVYLFIAALVLLREARVRQMAPDAVLAGFFRGRDANLKLLFNSISDALIVTDNDFNITGWNAAAETTYGWPAAEVIGRPVRDVLRTRYPPGANMAQAATDLRTAGTWRAEVVQQHRSGADITVLASVSLLHDDAGAAIGAVAVERDITERKRGEEEIERLNRRLASRAAELETANRELEAFAYSVSHDLRAPLRGIDGFSLALLEDAADRLDEEGQMHLRMVRQNAQRMGALIDDLLAFSRLGRQALSKQPVALHQVAERAWEELQPARLNRAVELRLGELPECAADASLLKQVYLNLFSNALKFSRTRALAVIEAGCMTGPAGEPTLYVRDNGVGFDMQYVDKLFGVFQRLHRAEDYEGTGVGLAIVQRIIQRHGGRAWAEGALDAGATFYFTLGEACCEP